jgi:hypothetical protein
LPIAPEILLWKILQMTTYIFIIKWYGMDALLNWFLEIWTLIDTEVQNFRPIIILSGLKRHSACLPKPAELREPAELRAELSHRMPSTLPAEGLSCRMACLTWTAHWTTCLHKKINISVPNTENPSFLFSHDLLNDQFQGRSSWIASRSQDTWTEIFKSNHILIAKFTQNSIHRIHNFGFYMF